MIRSLIRIAFWTTFLSGCSGTTTTTPEDPIVAEKQADQKTAEAYHSADEKALAVQHDADEKALAVANDADEKIAKIDAEAEHKVDEAYAKAEAVEVAQDKRVNKAYAADLTGQMKERLSTADKRLALAEAQAKKLPKKERKKAQTPINHARHSFETTSKAVSAAAKLPPEAFEAKRAELDKLFATLEKDVNAAQGPR